MGDISTLSDAKVKWFSDPVDTIEAAQALLDPEWLVMYAVFKTPEYKKLTSNGAKP